RDSNLPIWPTFSPGFAVTLGPASLPARARLGSNDLQTEPMPKKQTPGKEHIEYHKDGTLWARGRTLKGVPIGYWEWFRKDGTRLRSGHFEAGEQIGEWITYDKAGQKYKVTQIKPKAKKLG